MATIPITVRPYAAAAAALLGRSISWTGDTLRIVLLSPVYGPNLDHDAVYSDVQPYELPTGSGYVAGGITISGAAVTTTPAASWPTVWAADSQYTAGQWVRPPLANGLIYEAAQGGTTQLTQPAWPTVVGGAVVDGTVQWAAAGHGAVRCTFNTPAWPNFSAGPVGYAALLDSTPGSPATDPLILLWTYPAPETGGGGLWTIAEDPAGALLLPY